MRRLEKIPSSAASGGNELSLHGSSRNDGLELTLPGDEASEEQVSVPGCALALRLDNWCEVGIGEANDAGVLLRIRLRRFFPVSR